MTESKYLACQALQYYSGERESTGNILIWLADKGLFARYYITALICYGVKGEPREVAYRRQVEENRARLDRHRLKSHPTKEQKNK